MKAQNRACKNLAERAAPKLFRSYSELNQRRAARYVSLIPPSLTYNGSLSLNPINSLLPLRLTAPIRGGVCYENIVCNSCVGDPGELVCSRSKRLSAGLLSSLRSGPALPCLRSGPALPWLCSGPAVCRILRC